ncbi:MAG: hypothetical protein AAGF47_00395 [Planctomycetota bacterium]
MAANDRGDGSWGAVRRWVLRSSVAALALSLAVHLAMFLLATFVWFGGGGGGAEGPQEPGRAVEFAVMPESALEKSVRADVDVRLPSASDLLESDLGAIDPDLLALDPVDLSLDGDLSLELEIDAGGGQVAVDGSAGGGSIGGGNASFFGIEARGNRFAYIVDVSGSMDADGRLDALKSELGASITDLLDHVSFYVVTYADDAAPLGGRRDWTEANSVGKRWARSRLRSVEPLGATNPLPAFELVFAARPRPDAIYFMTDGQFNERIAQRIIAMNSERPTPIHCITFVTDDAASLMQRIAGQSGGTYTHIPGGGGRP